MGSTKNEKGKLLSSIGSSGESITYEPSVKDGRYVGYKFGFKFGLRPVDPDKTDQQPVEIFKGSATDQNVFYALFDDVGTDFELIIENESEYDIRLRITLNNCSTETRKLIIIRKGVNISLKSLETHGNHFHFESQETDNNVETTSVNAAAHCYRITVGVEIAENERTLKSKSSQSFDSSSSSDLTAFSKTHKRLVKCLMNHLPAPIASALQAKKSNVPDSSEEETSGHATGSKGSGTNQKFKPYYGFQVSEKLNPRKFILELRMKC